MYLEILTPDQDVFKGEADLIQLPGSPEKGTFEILNNHAPLVSSLVPGTVRVKTGDQEHIFRIKGGFVEVVNNKVAVLVEGLQEEN